MNLEQSPEKKQSTLPKEVYYYGREQKLPEVFTLWAGPLQMQYEAGALRYIRLGNQEIIRMIYIAVRDEFWDTMPVEIQHEEINQLADSFEIIYGAVCNYRHVRFTWQSRIIGWANGAINFEMDGQAHSAFRKYRIGFCVLHPLQECAGQPCTITDADGNQTTNLFPDYISPHQPFRNISQMEWSLAGGARVNLNLSGDIFETEDQRNWTDASFKTYCTPLQVPFPVSVTPGFKVQQSVSLQLENVPLDKESQDQNLKLIIPHEAQVKIKMPAVGIARSSERDLLSEQETSILKEINYSHYRVDVRFYKPDWKKILTNALIEAESLILPLEVALFFAEDEFLFLAQFIELMAAQGIPVRSVLLLHRQHNVTPSSLVELAGPILQKAFPEATIGGGTDHFFTELNRERLSTDGLDFLAYPINPQVHAFDNQTLIENLTAQPDTVKTAGHFAPGLPIHVSPVTLKIRYNPNGEEAEILTPDELPYPADVRQMSLFGAGWTLGSLKYLAEAGAESLTYFETVGLRGIIQGDARSAYLPIFIAEAGDIFPVYHLLRKLLEWTDAELVSTKDSAPLVFTSLLQTRNQHQRLFLANHTSQEQTIGLTGLRNGTGHLKILDERNVAAAQKFSGDFFGLELQELDISRNLCSLKLLPYAIAFLQTGQIN